MDKIKKRKINKELDKVFNKGIEFVDEQEQLIKESDFHWEDLNKMREELGYAMLEFANNVWETLSNKDIIDNLGEHKNHFDKLVLQIFHDLNVVSNKVAEISVKHETKSGKIETEEDYNLYNKISYEYHLLFSELTTLLGPSMTDLVVTTMAVLDKVKAKLINEEKSETIELSSQEVTEKQGDVNEQ